MLLLLLRLLKLLLVVTAVPAIAIAVALICAVARVPSIAPLSGALVETLIALLWGVAAGRGERVPDVRVAVVAAEGRTHGGVKLS